MPALVDIFNLALTDLAADLVADPQQLTQHAKTLAATFPTTRDAVLRAYPWTCAIARQHLPGAAAGALADYAYVYTLPVDPWCLRALNIIVKPGAPAVPFTVEGRSLYCDVAGPLPLRFIARVTNTELYDALLVQALAKRLASDCAYRITKKERELELFKVYQEVLAEARSIDGQEGGGEADYFESTLLEARI